MTCIYRRNGRRFASLHGKRTIRTLLTAAVAMGSLLPTLPAQGAPDGGVIKAGAGSISQQGSITTINQSASQSPLPARMVIDWNGFSSTAAESIVFNQPNASAIALNRVIGANPSQLLGSLTANGQVFILNPNGVFFGAGSQVNVGGMLASTLAMDGAGFMNGSYVLQGSSTAKVVNNGNLKAADGGYIALVGPSVFNDGGITANRGDALLAAGGKVTLRLEGSSLVGYSMDLGSLNALVDNGANGVIRANGGRVALEARAVDALSKAVVNHAGVIEAQTVDNRAGSIRLIGDLDYGQLQVSGMLDASAPNGGNGGFIETSAAKVKIVDGARVTTHATNGTTGTWLIDPIDFEVAPEGGPRTDSSIGALTLQANLANTPMTIGTTTGNAGTGKGDITVNATVAWLGDNRLTLSAYRNIIFNESIAGANVSLRYGQATSDGGAADFYFNNGAKIFLNGIGSFDTQKGSAGSGKNYGIVRSLGTESGSARDTLQGVNTSFNFVLGADIDASATKGWANGAGFNPLRSLLGTFEGLGHEVSNLFINRPQTDITGLFTSNSSNGVIRNLALTKADITGGNLTGGIAGQNSGSIVRSSFAGKVAGKSNVGGLVGQNFGDIANSFSSADVVGSAGIVGGLVGSNVGNILGSFSSGSVTARSNVGGLVSDNEGTIKDSYSQAQVNIGETGLAGGLVGDGKAGSLIENSFATGKMVGTGAAGGLIAVSAGTVTNSYWNTDTGTGTGVSTSAAGVGKTGAQLRQAATFGNWDLATVGGTDKTWRIYEGNSMPLLRSLLTPLVLDTTTIGYDGVTHNSQTINPVRSATGTIASGRNAGTYRPYSNQQGYDISNGELIITPKQLAITATVDTKIYDGTTAATATLQGKNVIEGDQVTAATTLVSFDDKNIGVGKAVSLTGITLSGVDAGNYSVQSTLQSTGRINPLNLVFAVGASDKEYDGTKKAAASVAGNQIRTDELFVGITASFDDKNVGINKTVTITDFRLTGKDAGNYTFTKPGTATATIRQRPLDVTATAADKVYDSTTSAGVLLKDDRISSDSLTTKALATFDDKNVGIAKNVTISGLSITGPDAANYFVKPLSLATTASITQRELVLTATAADKVYDGKTSAEAIFKDDRVASDTLVINATANFQDKNAGTAKNVAISGVSITGKDAANYLYKPQLLTTTASITQRALDVTATVADKVYDGTNSAVAVLKDDRITGDVLVANALASFDDKNAGTAKNVTISNVSITGADAANYLSKRQPLSTTASITRRALDVTAGAADKVYDGTASAVALLKDNRVAGDALVTSALASFDDKNVGTARNVTISGVSVTGADAANYLYQPQVLKTAASITQRPLELTATAADKAYDGTARASAVLSDNRVAGDALATSFQSADFADKNAGQQKTVTVSGIALAGADAINYRAGTSITTRGSISPVRLVISANPDKRNADSLPYQGGNGVTYAGFIPGETPAVLSGQLRYGGSAQGAVKEGSYQITPGGLNSVNYASTFVDGTLTIQPSLPGGILANAHIEPVTLAPLASAGRINEVRSMRVANCGIRMPENLQVEGCESAPQPRN